MNFALGHYDIQIHALPLLLMAFMVLAWCFVVFYPMVRILNRAGYSGWWVLLLFVPAGNVIGLWCFAFARWPAVAAKP